MRKALVKGEPGAGLPDWVSAGLDLVFPPECAGCELIGSAWCLNCQAATRRLEPPFCDRCGTPLGLSELCRDCRESEPQFEQAFSYAYYRDPFRKLIVELKYRLPNGLARLIADFVLETARIFAADSQVVVPIPLGSRRRRERGYNQIEEVARPLSRQLKLAFDPGALWRGRETASQVGLTPNERRDNIAGAFTADPIRLHGKKVFLIDDVYTTGATIQAACQALHQAGARSIRVFTLARAVMDPDWDPDEEFEE